MQNLSFPPALLLPHSKIKWRQRKFESDLAAVKEQYAVLYEKENSYGPKYIIKLAARTGL